MISISSLLLFFLVVSAAIACDVAMHGTNLRVSCAAQNLGVHGIDSLSLQDKLTEFPGATSISLDLQHNHILDDGARTVGSALEKLGVVKSLVLQLDGNSIGDAGAQSLGFSIAHMGKLRSLSLSLQYGNIGVDGFGVLGASLGRLQDLTQLTLKLRFNHVSSAGLGAFGRGLARMTSLESLTLDLYSNSIEDAGCSDFALSVSALTNLTSLSIDLRYNAITSPGSSDLLAVLHGMKKLTSTSVLLPPAPSPEPTARQVIDDVALADTVKAAIISGVASSRQEDGQETATRAPQQSALHSETTTPAASAVHTTDSPKVARTTASFLPTKPAHTADPGATVVPIPPASPAEENGPTTDSAQVVYTTTAENAVATDGTTTSAAPALESEESSAEDTSGTSPFVWVCAIALLGVFIAGALQAQGFDVLPVLRNAGTFLQERAGPILRSAGASVREGVSQFQARDYSTNLSSAVLDTEPPMQEVPIIVQQDSNSGARGDAPAATFNPRGPDLAARVDAAAAKVTASRRGPAANVSIEELLHQNLTSMNSQEQME